MCGKKGFNRAINICFFEVLWPTINVTGRHIKSHFLTWWVWAGQGQVKVLSSWDTVPTECVCVCVIWRAVQVSKSILSVYLHGPFIHSFIQFTNGYGGPLRASPGEWAANQWHSCPQEAFVLFGEIHVKQITTSQGEGSAVKLTCSCSEDRERQKDERPCDAGEQRPVYRNGVGCGARSWGRGILGGAWSSAKEARGSEWEREARSGEPWKNWGFMVPQVRQRTNRVLLGFAKWPATNSIIFFPQWIKQSNAKIKSKIENSPRK